MNENCKPQIQEITKSLHKFFLKERVQISWRPQMKRPAGNPDAKIPFVPYIEVGEVRQVLRKAVIEGLIYDWTAEYEILPLLDASSLKSLPKASSSEPNRVFPSEEGKVYVRCTLKLFVMTSEGPYTLQRQDIGEGADLKSAFSDSLKRAALHYGIGAVLEKLETHYLRDPKGEADKLNSLVERAYQQIYADLGEERVTPISQKSSSTLTKKNTETNKNTERDLPIPAPVDEKSPEIWERLQKADIIIGELLDRLPAKNKIKVVELIASLGWKRGVFSQGTPEEKESLVQSLGGPLKALEKAREIFLEAQREKGHV